MKNYEGYLFEGMSFIEIHRSLSKLSGMLKQKAHEKFKRFMANEIAYVYDLWCVDLGESVVHPWEDVQNDIRSKLCNLHEVEDQNIDYHFTVTIMPIEDDTTFLMTLNTLHQEFVEDLVQETEAIEYFYFADKKPPIGVDDEAWDSRRLRWDLAFKSSSQFDDGGYSRNLLSVEEFNARNYAPEDILTYIPSFDERCRRISMAMFMNSKKIRNINDLNRYLADPKTDNILKQYAAEIKPRLIEKFTLEQFRL